MDCLRCPVPNNPALRPVPHHRNQQQQSHTGNTASRTFGYERNVEEDWASGGEDSPTVPAGGSALDVPAGALPACASGTKHSNNSKSMKSA